MAMLLLGLIVGALAASVVWLAIGAGSRKRLAAAKREKEEIMLSIGLLLADADAIEANFRSGAIQQMRFTRSLGDKVNEITRAMRTNMHLLDVFFVKYAEQQAEEYMRMIENPERRKGVMPLSADPADDTQGGDETTDDLVDDDRTVGEVRIDDDRPAAASVAEDDGFTPPAAAPVAAAPVETKAPAEDEDAFVVPAAAAEPIVEDIVKEDANVDDDHAVEAGTRRPPLDDNAAEPSDAAPDTPEPSAAAAADEAKTEEDSWASQSLEDYEAGFAQFEVQDETGRETGGFIMSDLTASPEEKDPAPAIEERGEPEELTPVAEEQAEPEPEPVSAIEEQAAPEPSADEDDDLLFEVAAPAPIAEPDFTETIAYDRSVSYAPSATSTPLVEPDFTETIAYDRSVSYAAPPIQAEPPEEADASTGITGDDVGDAIDNLFKLK